MKYIKTINKKRNNKNFALTNLSLFRIEIIQMVHTFLN